VWAETVFVVVSTDSIARTAQILAVFTERVTADAFCDAQPRYWYRLYSAVERRVIAGDGPKTEDEWAMYWRRGHSEKYCGPWMPADAGTIYDDRDRFDLKWIELHVAEVPWNPVVATWLTDHAKSDELRTVVLETP